MTPLTHLFSNDGLNQWKVCCKYIYSALIFIKFCICNTIIIMLFLNIKTYCYFVLSKNQITLEKVSLCKKKKILGSSTVFYIDSKKYMFHERVYLCQSSQDLVWPPAALISTVYLISIDCTMTNVGCSRWLGILGIFFLLFFQSQ